ncbi:MnhB domain-containing protein [Nocardia pseudovaccinii]|uniref:MnhB domain-containing protein n=1 Tax=Nocardia pseudovaccinii TaxID=189540 RepID=UPI000AB8D778|nr:MnhB domain-containing protein [Nocardia pseudovaccinii]
MKHSARLVIFLVGGVGLVVLLGLALLRMPGFGGTDHPYRDAAVRASLEQHSPNAVSSVNFDQRGLDTFGEEAILVAAVLGAATLLRPEGHRPRRQSEDVGRIVQATRFLGYALLPVTLMIGADVVVHGHLTPGGGFQGGVVLATGLHLLYVAGNYRALRRVRPLAWYEFGEAMGMGTVVVLGLAGIFSGAGYLANILPLGQFGRLLSAGTLPLFSVAVGLAVGSGVVVLLAQFLDEYLTTERRASG